MGSGLVTTDPVPADGSPSFGRQLARRVASPIRRRRATGRSLVGAVGRSSLGFGRAVGRAQGIRPVVVVDELTSSALRPPAGFWHDDGDVWTASAPAGATGATIEPAAVPRSTSAAGQTPSASRPTTWTERLVPSLTRPATTAAPPDRVARRTTAARTDDKFERMRQFFELRKGGTEDLAAGAPTRSDAPAGAPAAVSGTESRRATPREHVDARPTPRRAGGEIIGERGDTSSGGSTGPGRLGSSMRPTFIDVDGLDHSSRSTGSTSSGGSARPPSPGPRYTPAGQPEAPRSGRPSVPRRRGRQAQQSDRMDTIRRLMNDIGAPPLTGDDDGGGGRDGAADRSARLAGGSPRPGVRSTRRSATPDDAGPAPRSHSAAPWRPRTPKSPPPASPPPAQAAASPTPSSRTPEFRTPESRTPESRTPEYRAPGSTTPESPRSPAPESRTPPTPGTREPPTQRDRSAPDGPTPAVRAVPAGDRSARSITQLRAERTITGRTSFLERRAALADRSTVDAGSRPVAPPAAPLDERVRTVDARGVAAPTDLPTGTAESATVSPATVATDVDPVVQARAATALIDRRPGQDHADPTRPRTALLHRPRPRLPVAFPTTDAGPLRRVTLPRALSATHRPARGAGVRIAPIGQPAVQPADPARPRRRIRRMPAGTSPVGPEGPTVAGASPTVARPTNDLVAAPDGGSDPRPTARRSTGLTVVGRDDVAPDPPSRSGTDGRPGDSATAAPTRDEQPTTARPAPVVGRAVGLPSALDRTAFAARVAGAGARATDAGIRRVRTTSPTDNVERANRDGSPAARTRMPTGTPPVAVIPSDRTASGGPALDRVSRRPALRRDAERRHDGASIQWDDVARTDPARANPRRSATVAAVPIDGLASIVQHHDVVRRRVADEPAAHTERRSSIVSPGSGALVTALRARMPQPPGADDPEPGRGEPNIPTGRRRTQHRSEPHRPAAQRAAGRRVTDGPAVRPAGLSVPVATDISATTGPPDRTAPSESAADTAPRAVVGPHDPATADTPTPATVLADRFMTELSRTIQRRPDPLPTSFRPMAEAIAGGRTVLLSTDHASRRALRSVGKVAATTADVIHLDPEPVPQDALGEVIAHELTHVAHPSPRPRFFDDVDDSPEERRAEQVAQAMARSPLNPSASILSAPTGRTGSPVQRRIDRSVPQRPPAPSVSPSAPPGPSAATADGSSTVSAADLAARITGTPSMAAVQRRSASPSASPAPAASPAAPSASPRAESSPMAMNDDDAEAWFREQLRTNFSHLMNMIEDRLVEELERRGGRIWGGL